jgi:hypothetical protein
MFIETKEELAKCLALGLELETTDWIIY